MIIDEAYLKNQIIPRKSDSRKGQNGIVGIVGGSRLYHGAPALSGLAALRSGCDLVYLFVPETIANPIRSFAPDLIVYPLSDSKITIGNSNKILNFRKTINSFVIGPGLSNQKMAGLTNLVSKLLKNNVKLVLDAGAINNELLNSIEGENVVITAHQGEFNKLIDKSIKSEEERKKVIKEYAKKHNFTVILKGEVDYITDGNQVFLNKSGNSAMTKGGTGDMLSGIIATHLAMNYKLLDAAIIGTYTMGKVGEIVYDKFGFQFLSFDFLDELAKYMKKFNKIK